MPYLLRKFIPHLFGNFSITPQENYKLFGLPSILFAAVDLKFEYTTKVHQYELYSNEWNNTDGSVGVCKSCMSPPVPLTSKMLKRKIHYVDLILKKKKSSCSVV